MASAKDKIRDYLIKHVGEEVSRETLYEVSGNIQDWPRALRTLRQETGLDIASTKNGYVLNSLDPIKEPRIRGRIDSKLRYAVLQRDNSTCRRCGANEQNTPGVKLVVDHKIPVELGGDTTINNLWTLCTECNGGKKAFFKDDDTELMYEIGQLKSAYMRLKRYFEKTPNVVISPTKLSIVAQTRDWTREVRKIRANEKMNIVWIDQCEDYPEGGYIYKM